MISSYEVFIYELPDNVTKIEIAHLFKLYLEPNKIYIMLSGCLTFLSKENEALGNSKMTRQIQEMSFPAGVRLSVFRDSTPIRNVDTTSEPLYVYNDNCWEFHNWAVKMKITDDKIYEQVKSAYLDLIIK